MYPLTDLGVLHLLCEFKAIKFKRFELYLRHVQKTKDNLEKRGINLDADATRAVPPKIALPIFENASLEDDDELHTLWSNLLANAMDPNFIGDVKSKHVSILKELEPLDLRVLHSCYEEKIKYRADKKFDEALFDKAKIVAVFGIADDLIEVALLSLMRQGCIKGGNIKTNLSFGDTPNTIYTGTNSFSVSLLGAELCRAALTS